MAATAGLGVLLETTTAQQKQQLLRPAAAPARTPAQIINKATLIIKAGAATTSKNVDVTDTSSSASFSCSSSAYRAPMALPVTAACSFLQRCFLCHRELADGRDIYMYIGDQAFCSEECRCRHILVDDDDDCTPVSAADCSRSRRCLQGISCGFAL